MKKETSIGQSRPNLLAIPHQLKELAQWMPYKLVQKQDRDKLGKVPHSKSGYPAAKTDRLNWLSFDECWALYEDGKAKFDGIGFCPNNPNLLFIDLDDCFQPDGSLDSRARELVDSIEGYVERSLSGMGVHIVTLADKIYGNPKSPDGKVEVFTSAMYLAMTGDVFEDRKYIPSYAPDTWALHKHLKQEESTKQFDDFENYSKRDHTLTLEKARDMLMNKLIPNPLYEDWLQLGMVLHFQFEGTYEALDLWNEYSQRDGAGYYSGYGDLEKLWNRFKLSHPNPVTIASIYKRLQNPDLTIEELLTQNPPLRYDTTKPKAVRYLLNGFMGEGVTSLAGASGAGKTTMIVEMASIVAHLCEEERLGIEKHFLKVRGRRRVVHFAEDTRQIEQALYAKRKYGEGASQITRDDEDVIDWYMLVQTKKYSAPELGKLIEAYSSRHTECWPTGIIGPDGRERFVVMPPLLIFDTASASFDLNDENSNSEQSKMIAAIKAATKVHYDPIWITSHVAKAARDKDVKHQTSRGAGAIEADAQTVATLARDIGMDCTILSLNKNRIQTQYDELQFHPNFHSEFVEDEWGDLQEVTYITGQLSKGTSSQRIASKQDNRKKTADIEKGKKLNENVLEAFKFIANAPAGSIYGKNDIRDRLSIGFPQSQAAIAYLLKGGYLVCRPLTREERIMVGGKRVGLFVGKDLLAERDFEGGTSND
jgi:hypothetical protein